MTMPTTIETVVSVIIGAGVIAPCLSHIDS
jgi:hypothetical protein